MTDTRREFIKKATLLTGSAGLFSILPTSIQKALAIDAEPGTTYLDAAHVVFLMQENRSFDHCYGTLQGVRGFNDPRAMRLPNKNSVWLQSNNAGHTYAPFNLDIKNSKATWMQSLPHSWENQVDARNGGKMDNWLESKKSDHKEYAYMPLTMGYYDRKDIPFYYALADAFTVCDQNFCSALTGTSANRSYFWTGTIRAEQNENSTAKVFNDEINFKDLSWTTFPERLERLGISWKVYQNELSVKVGLDHEEGEWLGNFADNHLEFHKQYNVKLHKAHLSYLAKTELSLQQEITELRTLPASEEQVSKLKEKTQQLEVIRNERKEWNEERYNQLSEFEKKIHHNAFVTNVNDPDYHQLETLSYNDNGTTQELKVPKGDILYQFREDVKNGALPTVTWLAAPGNFSDHPASPWYGAWYVSEVMDILTKNPEVWKKTIFILNYDENDGYFDHIAPFVPPHSAKPETGKCSAGMDTSVEHITKAQEEKRGKSDRLKRESPIGLGFRVPMVVASPWSRGGWVNSEVFDHTSCLQFLETFLSKKTGKTVKETNISDWRRAVCGDLSSSFRPYNGEKISYPASLNRNQTVQAIHQARFKPLPLNFKALNPEEIDAFNKNTDSLPAFPKQEKGTRRACALPYQLYASGRVDKAGENFSMAIKTGPMSGAPFNVYAAGSYRDATGNTQQMRSWAFALVQNDEISYSWPLNAFENGTYNLNLNGPNGFSRSFRGDKNDPELQVELSYLKSGDVTISISNQSTTTGYEIRLRDQLNPQESKSIAVGPGQHIKHSLSLQASLHWYDLKISCKDFPEFTRHFAGRVETGRPGFTDPKMG